MARRWAERGAPAAPRGGPRRRVRRRARQAALIRAMVEAVPAVPVEVGGGLRDLAHARGGARRRAPAGPSLGTARRARAGRARGRRAERWPGRILVGGGRGRRRAWRCAGGPTCSPLTAHGAGAPRGRRGRGARVIYTDIAPRRHRAAARTSRRTAALAARRGRARHRLGRHRRASTTSSGSRPFPNVAGAIVGPRALHGRRRPRRGARRGGGLTAMLARRVIPCLDVKDGRVVKGVRFVDLRDAGDPVEAALAYDAQGADELVFLDITASHEGRATMLDVVRRTAEAHLHAAHRRRRARGAGGRPDACSAPAPTRSRSTRRRCATRADPRGGAALRQPVHRGRDRRQAPRGGAGPAFEVYTHGGRRPTGRDAVAWAREVVDLGAGEILLTSMDRDGTRRRLRPRADARGRRGRLGPGDRLGRRGHARASPRRPRAGQGRRRRSRRRSSTSAEHTVPEAKRVPARARGADPPRGAPRDGRRRTLRFDAQGLIPAVVQEADDRRGADGRVDERRGARAHARDPV